jgi:hypothetical protein
MSIWPANMPPFDRNCVMETVEKTLPLTGADQSARHHISFGRAVQRKTAIIAMPAERKARPATWPIRSDPYGNIISPGENNARPSQSRVRRTDSCRSLQEQDRRPQVPGRANSASLRRLIRAGARPSLYGLL